MKNWFRKFVIRAKFSLIYRERVCDIFTWHGRLFVLTQSNMLYEIYEDHTDHCVITLRKYLDPSFDLEAFMEHIR
ncbi:hypothetical protein LCGC14_1084180 [marine sediment metagenome]|uniref:Uncharacterized protein n=1 Tax=marine sediment metagenome TaxID=412755 RepID=A0A0F9MEK0_9ZZZZ